MISLNALLLFIIIVIITITICDYIDILTSLWNDEINDDDDDDDNNNSLARVRIRSLSPSALMQHASFRLLLSYSDVRSGVMQSPVCPHSLRQALKQFEAANGAA